MLITHKSKYKYPGKYQGLWKVMKIICPTHGEFFQRPGDHVNGRGCGKCAGCFADKTSFIEKSNLVHNNTYNYLNVIYKTSQTPVEILCPIHGSFWQQPNNHLSGAGCPICANKISSDKRKLKFLNFVQQSIIQHRNNYYYYNNSYFGRNRKTKIKCKNCNNIFYQLAGTHMTGCGCPKCAKYGFDPNKPAILYYLKHIESGYYKSGITNRTVEKRFGGRVKEFKILNITKYKVGSDARKKEVKILKKYKEFNISYDSFQGNGGTEFFTQDILKKGK